MSSDPRSDSSPTPAVEDRAKKTGLTIIFTEPLVFLRPRDIYHQPNSTTTSTDPGPPSLVRGLLTLTLAKPTRISRVSLELTCVTRNTWPEGQPSDASPRASIEADAGVAGSRKMVPPEERTVYRAEAVYFDGSSPLMLRRSMSLVDPPLRLLRGEAPASPNVPTSTAHYNQPQMNARRGFSSERANQQREPVVLFETETGIASPPVTPGEEAPLYSLAYTDVPPTTSGSPQSAQSPSSASPTRPGRTPTTPRDDDGVNRGRRLSGFRLYSLLGASRKSSRDNQAVDAGSGEWKEFKAGTYTYPISFTIPADSPPALPCDRGGVEWRMLARVRRPGLLVPSLTAERLVGVCVGPGDEHLQDMEPVTIERQWEHNAHGLLTVFGRTFVEGRAIPLSIKLVPLDKVKLDRIDVFLDEKISYLTGMRHVASEASERYTLLSLKNADQSQPLLPLNTDSAHPLIQSPLAAVFIPPNLDDEERAILAASFFGPGPWQLDGQIPLPGRGSALLESNHNRRANILIKHTLRVSLRMSHSGASDSFHYMVFDYPVYIFPWACGPEFVTLPDYSEESSEAGVRPKISLVDWPFQERTLPSAHWGRGVRSRLIWPARTNQVDSELYERLVAGRQSEAGDQPPGYRPPSYASHILRDIRAPPARE